MLKSAIRQTKSIALAAVIAVALFAPPAAASELSQDEIDRIMSMRAAPYREDAELEPLPPGKSSMPSLPAKRKFLQLWLNNLPGTGQKTEP